MLLSRKRTQRGIPQSTVNAANRGLLLNDWPIGNGLGPLVYSNSLTGSGGRSNAIRGLNKLNGDIATELRYSGLEHVFAQIMGSAGAPVPVAGDSTAQTHIFQLANDVTGLFDTVAVMKVGPLRVPALPIWEYPSVKYGWLYDYVHSRWLSDDDDSASLPVPVMTRSRQRQ